MLDDAEVRRRLRLRHDYWRSFRALAAEMGLKTHRSLHDFIEGGVRPFGPNFRKYQDFAANKLNERGELRGPVSADEMSGDAPAGRRDSAQSPKRKRK